MGAVYGRRGAVVDVVVLAGDDETNVFFPVPDLFGPLGKGGVGTVGVECW